MITRFLKNKFFRALLFALTLYGLLELALYLFHIQIGMGGIYTPQRQLLSKSALFLFLLTMLLGAIKEKSWLFNLSFVLFTLILVEAVLIEKGNGFGIRYKKVIEKQKTESLPKNPTKKITASKPKKQLAANLSSSVPHPDLGYKSKPGTYLVRKNCYEVIYTNTKDGLRSNPVENNTNKLASLFGCSFTYGTGLNDTETLAANLATVDSSRNYLTIAEEGYGIQQMLTNLETPTSQNPYLDSVFNQSDVGIYFYLHDHIYRLLGKNHIISYHWGTDFPFYDINLEQQSVKRKGTLGEQLNFFQRNAYFPVHISLIYKKLYFNYFYGGAEAIQTGDFEKTALALKYAQQLFLKKGNNKRFIVVLFPNTNLDDNGAIKDYLIKQGVEVLDLSNLIAKADIPNYTVCKSDNHPNAKLNKLVSQELVKFLTVGSK